MFSAITQVFIIDVQSKLESDLNEIPSILTHAASASLFPTQFLRHHLGWFTPEGGALNMIFMCANTPRVFCGDQVSCDVTTMRARSHCTSLLRVLPPNPLLSALNSPSPLSEHWLRLRAPDFSVTADIRCESCSCQSSLIPSLLYYRRP